MRQSAFLRRWLYLLQLVVVEDGIASTARVRLALERRRALRPFHRTRVGGAFDDRCKEESLYHFLHLRFNSRFLQHGAVDKSAMQVDDGFAKPAVFVTHFRHSPHVIAVQPCGGSEVGVVVAAPFAFGAFGGFGHAFLGTHGELGRLLLRTKSGLHSQPATHCSVQGGAPS